MRELGVVRGGTALYCPHVAGDAPDGTKREGEDAPELRFLVFEELLLERDFVAHLLALKFGPRLYEPPLQPEYLRVLLHHILSQELQLISTHLVAL